MKIAYVFCSFSSGMYRLNQTILPQLEAGTHGMDVVGMCFFDECALLLKSGEPVYKRLLKLAIERNITLMVGELSRSGKHLNETLKLRPNERTVITIANGEEVGCYPDIYTALGDNIPDHLISI